MRALPMSLIFLSLSLLLATRESLALGPIQQPVIDCPYLSKVDFLKPQTALAEFGRPLALTTAMAKITILTEMPGLPGAFNTAGARCTGSYISDDGHILTASHCLDDCLFNDNGKPKMPEGVSSPPQCRILIGDSTEPIKFEVTKANSCSMSVRSALRKNIAHATPLTPKACQDGNLADVAILKPVRKPKDFSCLSLASAPPQLGNPLISLSYPRETFRAANDRPDAKDANGTSLYFSSGRIINEATCERTITNPSKIGAIFQPTITVIRPLAPQIRDINPDLFQTTVDSEYGSSGAPLLNENDEIVGVISKDDNKASTPENECRGATFGQPTNMLTDTLSRKGIRCNSKLVETPQGT